MLMASATWIAWRLWQSLPSFKTGLRTTPYSAERFGRSINYLPGQGATVSPSQGVRSDGSGNPSGCCLLQRTPRPACPLHRLISRGRRGCSSTYMWQLAHIAMPPHVPSTGKFGALAQAPSCSSPCPWGLPARARWPSRSDDA